MLKDQGGRCFDSLETHKQTQGTCFRISGHGSDGAESDVRIALSRLGRVKSWELPKVGNLAFNHLNDVVDTF